MFRLSIALLIVLAQLAQAPVKAQTTLFAPGGVAAGTISQSTITIFNGLTSEEHRALVEVFTHQLAVSSEARAQAERRVGELAATLGFTRAAVENFFRIVGERQVPLEQLPQQLALIAERHREQLARLTVLAREDPVKAALAEQARTAIDQGRYAQADELFARAEDLELASVQAADRLAAEAQSAAEQGRARAATARGERGQIAMIQLHYAEAASHFAKAAAISSDRSRRYWLVYEGQALVFQGFERGDNRAAQAAIERGREVLQLTTRQDEPHFWGVAQRNLGLALAALGGRQLDPGLLEQAVASYNLALEELTRERDLIEWTSLQVYLGAALLFLGERKFAPELVDRAATAYRAALVGELRERDALYWAWVQMNLAGSLIFLAKYRPGRALYDEALEVTHSALQALTFTRQARMWAKVQHIRGLAFQRLGTFEADVATRNVRFEQAVASFQLALAADARERVPLDWALSQRQLGTSLAVLAESYSDPVRLDQAIEAFRLALEELSRELAPSEWAVAQLHFSMSLQLRAKRRTGTSDLEEAVTAASQALQIYELAGGPPLEIARAAKSNADKLLQERRAAGQ